jgi:hypothetical protein
MEAEEIGFLSPRWFNRKVIEGEKWVLCSGREKRSNEINEFQVEKQKMMKWDKWVRSTGSRTERWWNKRNELEVQVVEQNDDEMREMLEVKVVESNDDRN